MVSKPEKVMVIGIDSTIVPRLYKWAQEGELPNLKALMDRGVFCPNALVPYPTITPPNWTTIATGAWAMTHGITDYDTFIPGRELDDCRNGYLAEEVQAEGLWSSLENAGKNVIVANYPTTWPGVLKNGVQIGGCGLGLTDWRVELPINAGNYGSLTLDFCVTTDMYPFADEVSFKKASGWQGVQLSPAALDTEVTIALRRNRWKMDAPKFYVALDKSAGSSVFDTVIVAKAKNQEGVYCTVKNGQWSEKVYDTFQTEDGPKQAVFQFKVLELSPDGQVFRMYCPGLNAIEGWAFPEGAEAEFVKECRGLPLGKTGWEALVYDWIDRATMAEITQSQHEFLADASYWLLTHKPWDYFITHIHPVDWIYHAWGRELDPNTAEDKSMIPAWTALELEIYRQSDWALGRLLEAADMEKTLVVVVSDHGAKAAGKRFKVNELLAKAGLLAYADEGPVQTGEKETTLGARPQRSVDWSKTKVFAQRHIHIYLNVKGRDPHGIVDPGEEYERLREQVIRMLYDYTDAESGRKPVVLALKREDAAMLQLGGPRTGDIVYALDPAFGLEHGEFLPTAKWGVGDLHGLFILAGPGIKQGVQIERVVRLVDVVPTVCHLAEWPVPAQCEGGIIYQALEDSNAKNRELESLRRNVERLKRMVERPPMC
ncbi:MAG: alkaline phosphatase family protein [Chloroflexota bacterium]